MVRLFNVYYPTRIFFLLFEEAIVICASFVAAGLIQFRANYALMLSYEIGAGRIALVAGVCLLCLYYFDLYDTGIVMNEFEILTRLIQVLGTTCLILAALYYLLPPTRIDGRFLGLGLLLAGVSLAASRKLFLVLNRTASLAQRTIILGNGSLASSLAMEIQKRPELGIRLVGCVTDLANHNSDSSGMHVLGGISDLPTLVERAGVSQVIVAMTERRGRLPVESLLRLKSRGVRIRNGEEIYEGLTSMVPLTSFQLSWLLYSPSPTVSRPMLVYKRAASLIFSALGLLLTSPLWVLIAVSIRLDSKGRILFTQERVGKDGKTFTLFKFRSMREGSESSGRNRPAQANDDRITRVGRLLRRTRLDELPQLYNILRGDMYFVGPRPFVPDQEREFVEKIPFYNQRWIVRPGATGWAQVNLGYCASVEENSAKLAYDLFYIKNVSLGLDLLIIFRTIKTLLLGRGSR